MKAAVLDASIIARWHLPPAEPATAALRADYEARRLFVHVPTLLFLEVLNVAGRQLRWTEDLLQALVDRLRRSKLDIRDPELDGIATWVARGLTAYDATYVALAEQLGVPLVTTDRAVLDVARVIAVRPEAFSSLGS